jgi:hypothetical protein
LSTARTVDMPLRFFRKVPAAGAARGAAAVANAETIRVEEALVGIA